MTPHRWSGWPGAWCLDCGAPDPVEECLAADLHEDGNNSPPGPWVDCPTHKPTSCPEPGSHGHDPYWKMEHPA